MSDRPDLSILLLTYNEAPHVFEVVQELTTFLATCPFRTELVLVDDGSTDASCEHVTHAFERFADLQRTTLRTVRHEKNRGMGAAIKSGSAAATGRFVTFLPADGQIAPEAVRSLFDTATASGADIVLSTYPNRNDGLHRKVLSAGVRSLIFLTYGVAIESDGPYLFTRGMLQAEQFEVDTFFLNFAFPIRAKRSGLKVASTVVQCRPRIAGSSKTANLHTTLRVARDLLVSRGHELRAHAAAWLPRTQS